MAITYQLDEVTRTGRIYVDGRPFRAGMNADGKWVVFDWPGPGESPVEYSLPRLVIEVGQRGPLVGSGGIVDTREDRFYGGDFEEPGNGPDGDNGIPEVPFDTIKRLFGDAGESIAGFINKLRPGEFPEWLLKALVTAGVITAGVVALRVVGGALLGGVGGRLLGGAATRFLGGGGDNGMAVMQSAVVGQWQAGVTTFYRLADGRLATINKKGKVKTWRPKHPIVIFSDGARDMKLFLRADRALDRQAKTLMTALRRRTAKNGRKSSTVQIIEAGPGSVRVSGK